MTSARSPASTSLMSCTERSWPTASGISVSGSGTLSRSGSTGSTAGSARGAPTSMTRSPPASSTSITDAPSRPGSLVVLRQLDRDLQRARSALHQRKLDPQDAVAVGRRGLFGDDVGAERDYP